jgi:SAM-dependent methyltransferase
MNMVVNKVVTYNVALDRYYMTKEMGDVFLTSDSDVYMGGAIIASVACVEVYESTKKNFLQGGGTEYFNMSKRMIEGTAAFGIGTFLKLESYLVPCAPQIEKRLKDGGAYVLDLGCGRGFSTKMLAEAYPKCTFMGIDYDQNVIDYANEHMVWHDDFTTISNIRFATGNALTFGTDERYDVVFACDCWHDMAFPTQVAVNIHRILRKGGFVFLLEPIGYDSVAETLSSFAAPVLTGCAYALCQACSRAGGENAECLGPMCFNKKYVEIWTKAGFSSVKQVPLDPAKMPFNRLFVMEKSQ